MSVFMIGYDLHEGEDYEDLIDAIDALSSGYWHFLDSTWLVTANSTTNEIRDKLIPHLPRRDRDRLLIVKIPTPAHYAQTNAFTDEAQDWLKNNLSG